MAKTLKREKALELRKKGKSIKEISRALNVAKSTVSAWCRDIILGRKQIEGLIKKQRSGSYRGRMIIAEKFRRIRIEEEKLLRIRGLREIGKLTKRELFITGIGMYWSEGETYLGSDKMSFTNSDAKMVLFMLKWFKEICGISQDRFSLQIRINKTHKNRVKKIEKYWSKITRIPLVQFTKTILIKNKAKKVYSNPETYFGTLRILVLRGTKLRRIMNGWIEGLTRGIKLPA